MALDGMMNIINGMQGSQIKTNKGKEKNLNPD